MKSTLASHSPLRAVPYMGVIWVVAEAHKLGFRNGDPDWCNLGQGQPEVGEMAGAPKRISSVEMLPGDHAYGPLEGTPELRERIAAHYNRLYRRGKKSQYAARNVAVAQGGRLALTRAMATLGAIRVGYQVPDYTAYEDMLGAHLWRIRATAIPTEEKDGFRLTAARLKRAVTSRGLDAVVISNPCNPTGTVIEGAELASMVRLARDRGTLLMMDEFYSHFIYTAAGKPANGPVSSAAFVDDVDRDPVLVFDGLTKSFRYPGWRVGWVLGPPEMVETMARAASAIDGGPSRIAQRAALAALEPKRADRETSALRKVFAAKRNLMVARLKSFGIRFAAPPRGTFYCWACLDRLKAPFDDSMSFFRQALARKVLTVPGEFFDVNPGQRRRGPSSFRKWMRFSFGPPMENVKLGLDRLEAMLAGE